MTKLHKITKVYRGQAPVRILNLISTLDTGGAETYLSRLIDGMDSEMFLQCVVSMTDVGPVGDKILSGGTPVYCLGMKKGLPDPKGIVALIRIVRDFKPDIIHCWMYHANILGLLMKLFFKNARILWNIRCSNMDFSKYGLVYANTVRLGALFSGIPDCLIANSYAGKEFHESIGYKNTNWKVIHNGVDPEFINRPLRGCVEKKRKRLEPESKARSEIRKDLCIPEEAVVICLVARLDPMKDHETFFKAAHTLLQKYPDVHFILAGRGVDDRNEEIINFISPVEQKDKIHLLGERDDIGEIYAASDLASSSSSYGEGFSNAIAEAMAAKLPCVVTDAGDSALIVGDTGVVVSVKDPYALAEAWAIMIESGSGSLRRSGELAAERIRENFNITKSIEKYESMLG